MKANDAHGDDIPSDDHRDEISNLLLDVIDIDGSKTYTELLSEGTSHAGGLRMLAEAELTTELMNPDMADKISVPARQMVNAFLDLMVESGPAIDKTQRREAIGLFRELFKTLHCKTKDS